MLSPFVFGLFAECLGVSVSTARYWRAVVANLVAVPAPVLADFEDGTTEQISERLDGLFLRSDYVMLSRAVCVPMKPSIVADRQAVDCSAVCFVRGSSKPSLELFGCWLAMKPNRFAWMQAVIADRVEPEAEHVDTRGNYLLAAYCRPSVVGRLPRRITGRNGSRFDKPSVDWAALGTAVGAELVLDVLAVPVSDFRRLDLLASVVARQARSIKAARQAELETACERIGFADCASSTARLVGVVASDEFDATTARILAKADERDERTAKLAMFAETMLDGFHDGLAMTLIVTGSVPKAAAKLGLPERTVRRYRDNTRTALADFARNSAD